MDRLPPQAADERAFSHLLRRAIALALHEHLTAGRAGPGPLDPELAADAYRRTWTDGELHEHGAFVEGLSLLHRWVALLDLAPRELWPWARRVVVAFDLLRHDVVVAITRTDGDREATRRYLAATLTPIEHREFPARPSTLCARCNQRGHCPAYAEARAGGRREVGAEPGDLPAVAREREEVAVVVKAAGERKDTLDAILRDALGGRDELRLEGRRYALVTAHHRAYPLLATLRALEGAGVPRETALARLGAVHASDLKPLLTDLAKTLSRPDYEALQAALEREVRCSLVTRLTAREVRS